MSTNSSFSPRGNRPEPQTSENASTPDLRPSENYSEKSNSQPEAKTPPKSEADKLAAVQDLFSGDKPKNNSPKDGGEQADTDTGYLDDYGEAPAPNAAQAKSLDIESLSEQLGMTQEQLYKALKITTGDGEPLTLGELKDKVQGQQAAERESVKRERALDERESALLQNQQLLAQIGNELQGRLSPQTLNQIKQRQANYEAHQNRLMYETMPELRDKQNFERFRRGVVDTLTPYGFKANELNVTDHRILLVVRDLMRTKAQLKRLMDFEPPKPDAQPPKQQRSQAKRSRASNAQRLKQQAVGGTEAQKVSAVAELIRGK